MDGLVRPDSILPQLAPCQGHVSGVFRRSLTVTLGDHPVNLHLEAEALTPLGIWVETLAPSAFSGGENVTFAWPDLRIGGAPGWRLLHDPRLDPPSNQNHLRTSVQTNVQAENLETMRKALTLFARPSQVTSSLWRPARNVVPASMPHGSSELCHPEVDGQFPASPVTSASLAVKAIAKRLSLEVIDLGEYRECFGAGEGLTPAFDDFCAGLLLADVWMARGFERMRKVQFSDDLDRYVSSRTTPVSAWQLRFAGEGRSSLSIERFLEAFLCQKVSLVSVARILNLGHSSGSDILSGIWCRLRGSPDNPF